jgi:hypothetical protein
MTIWSDQLGDQLGDPLGEGLTVMGKPNGLNGKSTGMRLTGSVGDLLSLSVPLIYVAYADEPLNPRSHLGTTSPVGFADTKKDRRLTEWHLLRYGSFHDCATCDLRRRR